MAKEDDLLEDVPVSVAEAEMDFCGLKVKVHVLSDGRRVIEAADMERIMRVMLEGDEAGHNT